MCLGPGAFALPFVMAEVGFALGLLLHIIVAITTSISLKNLLECAEIG